MRLGTRSESRRQLCCTLMLPLLASNSRVSDPGKRTREKKKGYADIQRQCLEDI